jgi:alpha-N-arabinofuranosidase
MKIYIPVIMAIALLLGSCNNNASIKEVNITIDPGKKSGTINEMVYGHFYEHIYHSANGGLWGDMIWNRSFEEYPEDGEWSIENGVLSQENLGTDIKIIFGDKSWVNYDFSLEAKKTGGYEGFLILFRAEDDENFYWYNIGGWGNSRHALEKETDNSREVLPNDTRGKIEEDIWYKIRIRCEENKFTAWIDGEKTLEYIDENNPHLRGGVGIGSWSTSVKYRNLEIRNLDGQALFSGLPELPDRVVLPRNWNAFGDPELIPDSEDALNSEYCIGFGRSAGNSGIYLENISVKSGINYYGSIWIKGNPEDKLIVRLSQGDEELAENILTGFTREWKEYRIHFLPLKTTVDAAIYLLPQTGKGFSIDQFSLLSEEDLSNDGFRTDLYNAVNDLQPPVIRWPGGCFAELYRWKDGIGPQHERVVYPATMWDDKDVNSLGTDEFITLCRKLGSEPLIVINSGFHEGAATPAEWEPWIREACEWIEYCNGPADSEWGSKRSANGQPEPYKVKYWEIDNELWRSRVPDPKIYSEAVKLFSAAMRETDPSITIIAHGGNGTDERWNKILLENSADYFDVLSVHHYMDPDRFDKGVDEQEAFYQRTSETISASSNPDIKLYVSEWNAQSTDWRTGLYAGGLLNAFERCGDFLTMAGPALFLRHTSAGAWDNAFINFDHSGWYPAPNYVVMKLWREHFAPVRLESICDDDDINLVASTTEAGEEVICKLVNPSGLNKKINIKLPESYKPDDARLVIVMGDSLTQRNTMESPGTISPSEEKIKINGHSLNFTIPGYSCGLVKIGLR